MGSKEMGLFLIFFACLCLFASPHPLQRALLSAGTHEDHINGIDDVDSNGRGGLAHGSKYAHGSEYGGARGGGASGSAETANGNGVGGGGDVQGGRSAVIPVIVAGAANNNHHPNNHHKGAGSHHQVNCILLPTLIMTNLASLSAPFLQVFGLLV